MNNIKKTLFRIALCSTMLAAASCGLAPKNYTQDAAGIEAWGEDLKDKFGADAWYTHIFLSYSYGKAAVGATETDDPASLKMREWCWSSQTKWMQTSDVTLEMEGDASPETFMFQLDKDVDIKLVGSLVEKSMAQLTAEKNIAKPRIQSVSLVTPDDEDKSATRIDITLEPENGGTRFRFLYTLSGELISFDY